MKALKVTAIVAACVALGWVSTFCGEAATGQTPEQVWANFEKNIMDGNMIALPGLASKELVRSFGKDRMAFAGLQATIATAAGGREIEILSQSKDAVRMKVTYKGPDDKPWSEDYTVLMEKPKKNWKVTKIEGNVSMNLPMF